MLPLNSIYWLEVIHAGHLCFSPSAQVLLIINAAYNSDTLFLNAHLYLVGWNTISPCCVKLIWMLEGNIKKLFLIENGDNLFIDYDALLSEKTIHFPCITNLEKITWVFFIYTRYNSQSVQLWAKLSYYLSRRFFKQIENMYLNALSACTTFF